MGQFKSKDSYDDLTDAPSPIDILTDDALFIIFSMLTLRERIKAGGVCRRWNNLVKDGRFWLCIDIAAFLRAMLPVTSRVQIINIQELSRVEEETLWLLNVYACTSTREIRMYLASNRILRLIRERCPNLETIGIKHYENLKLEILSRRLKGLHLETGVVKRWDNGIMWIYFRKKSHVLQRAIESFDFATIPFPKLQDLSLGWAFLDGEVFRGLSSNTCGIRHLTLAGCRFESSKALKDTLEIVATAFPNLEILHMDRSSCTCQFELDRFFELLSERTTLRCLQLRSQNGKLSFSANSFEIMTLGLGNSLSSLGLTTTSEVDDIVLCLIARNLHKLRDLDVSGCFDITDEGLSSFSCHPCLEAIDITGCGKITYNTIARTIESIPRIKQLTLTEFRNRTDLDWVKLNDTRLRLDHLKVSIKPEWSARRYTCPYCPGLQR